MTKAEPMRTLTISLSPKQLGTLQRAVDTGSYASNSEVVREALRLWEQQQEVRALALSQLKRAYDEGLASGEGRAVDAQHMLAELKATARAVG
jgi:antitoxin ParD1/3/4